MKAKSIKKGVDSAGFGVESARVESIKTDSVKMADSAGFRADSARDSVRDSAGFRADSARDSVDSAKTADSAKLDSTNHFERSLTFHPVVRLFHWIRALCVVFLIFSGFYIAYPFLSPEPNGEPTSFLYALFRSWHIMAGFLLVSVTMFRLYYFIAKSSRGAEKIHLDEVLNIGIWIGQIKNYLFLGKHPHIKGLYNPLQVFAYFSFGMMLVVISLTGFVLYYNVYHNGLGGVLAGLFKWVEVACGGLANVRQIHHITTWAICIFICTHIYMAVWNAIKHPDGGIDSMVGGYRYQKKK